MSNSQTTRFLLHVGGSSWQFPRKSVPTTLSVCQIPPPSPSLNSESLVVWSMFIVFAVSIKLTPLLLCVVHFAGWTGITVKQWAIWFASLYRSPTSPFCSPTFIDSQWSITMRQSKGQCRTRLNDGIPFRAFSALKSDALWKVEHAKLHFYLWQSYSFNSVRKRLIQRIEKCQCSPYGRRSIDGDITSYKKPDAFSHPLGRFSDKKRPSLASSPLPMKLMRVGRRDPCRDNGGNADCLVICRPPVEGAATEISLPSTASTVVCLLIHRGYPSPVIVSFDVPYKHFTHRTSSALSSHSQS